MRLQLHSYSCCTNWFDQFIVQSDIVLRYLDNRDMDMWTCGAVVGSFMVTVLAMTIQRYTSTHGMESRLC